MKRLKGLMLASCASNSGKTVTSISLICALDSMGIPVIAAKSGPDYIDSSWLSWASRRPAGNLDSRMASECGLKMLLKRMSAELKDDGLLIVEAAMGFYDGDRQGRSSAAELAARLKLPVILLLNARGCAHSLAAMAQGFIDYETDWMSEWGKPRILGVICTHTGGASHAQLCEEVLEPVLERRGLEFFGTLCAKNAPSIPSRHLGLSAPQENVLKRELLASYFNEAMDMGKILRAVGHSHKQESNAGRRRTKREKFFFSGLKKKGRTGPTLAIAWDQAFSFCYADLPAMLKEWGARIIFFSPLRDHALPPCDCVYLPGGYPELYARELSGNREMIKSLRNAAEAGKPVYGECGGYVYLGQSLKVAARQRYQMCGLLPPHFALGDSLCALGYREVRCAAEKFPLSAKAVFNAHEFHYSRLLSCDADASRLWKYRDRKGNEVYDGFIRGRVMGGWMHLYPEGSRTFWRFFLSLAHGDK